MEPSPFRRLVRVEYVRDRRGVAHAVAVRSFVLVKTPGVGAELTDAAFHRRYDFAAYGGSPDAIKDARGHADWLCRKHAALYARPEDDPFIYEQAGNNLAYHSELRAVAGMAPDVPEAVLADWYMDRSDIVLAVDPL